MTDNKNRGHTKEEYYRISEKQGLPKRCPVLGNCCRAVMTRYMMGFKLGRSDISFKEFLVSEGQVWNPDKMIKEIERVSVSSEPDVFYSIENSCPEVTLFEPDYLPFKFKQLAFGEAGYYKESKRFEAVPKHYSECAEFSQYLFHQEGVRGATTKRKRKRSHISRTMKFEIFHRDEFRCYYCKRHKDELPKGVHLTLDHKVPYIDGGADSFENLVTACSECNSGKSNKVINDL